MEKVMAESVCIKLDNEVLDEKKTKTEKSTSSEERLSYLDDIDAAEILMDIKHKGGNYVNGTANIDSVSTTPTKENMNSENSFLAPCKSMNTEIQEETVTTVIRDDRNMEITCPEKEEVHGEAGNLLIAFANKAHLDVVAGHGINNDGNYSDSDKVEEHSQNPDVIAGSSKAATVKKIDASNPVSSKISNVFDSEILRQEMMKLLPELLQQMQHNSSPEPSPKLNNTRQTTASKNLSQQPQKSSYENELSKSCDNRIAKCENVLTTTDLNNESSSLCPKESDLSICNQDKTKIDSILDFETIQDPIQIDTSKNVTARLNLTKDKFHLLNMDRIVNTKMVGCKKYFEVKWTAYSWEVEDEVTNINFKNLLERFSSSDSESNDKNKSTQASLVNINDDKSTQVKMNIDMIDKNIQTSVFAESIDKCIQVTNDMQKTDKNLQMSVIKKFDKDIQVSTINIEKIIQVPEIEKDGGNNLLEDSEVMVIQTIEKEDINVKDLSHQTYLDEPNSSILEISTISNNISCSNNEEKIENCDDNTRFSDTSENKAMNLYSIVNNCMNSIIEMVHNNRNANESLREDIIDNRNANESLKEDIIDSQQSNLDHVKTFQNDIKELQTQDELCVGHSKTIMKDNLGDLTVSSTISDKAANDALVEKYENFCLLRPLISNTKSMGQEEIASDKCDYFCPQCCVQISNKLKLAEHIISHLTFLHRCEICLKGFHDNRKYMDHCKNDHSASSAYWMSSKFDHQCSFCLKTFRRKLQLIKHQRTKFCKLNEIRKYNCYFCYKVFNKEDSLKKHISLHQVVRIDCTTCLQSFSPLENGIDHECSGSSDIKLVYNYNNKYTKLAKPRKMRKPKSKCQFKKGLKLCVRCVLGFRNHNEFEEHVNSEYCLSIQSNEHFRCFVCKNDFQDVAKLKLHVVTCFKERLSTLLRPSQKESKKSAKEHYQNGVHHCSICSTFFASHKSFKKHETFHKEPEDFTCYLCDFQCHSKGMMRRHLQENNCESEGYYPCFVCDYLCVQYPRFGTLSALIQHLKSHTISKLLEYDVHFEPVEISNDSGSSCLIRFTQADIINLQTRPGVCNITGLGSYQVSLSGEAPEKKLILEKIENNLSYFENIQSMSVGKDNCDSFDFKVNQSISSTVQSRCFSCLSVLSDQKNALHHFHDYHKWCSADPSFCDKCSTVFKDRLSFDHHLLVCKAKEGTFKLSCDVNKKILENSCNCIECQNVDETMTTFITVCKLCDKQFQCMEQITHHQSNMHSMLPYLFVCGFCDSPFLDYESLREHLFRTEHETSEKIICHFVIVDWPCHVCKTKITSLSTHIDSHVTVMLECFICNVKMSNKSMLIVHLAKYHNTEWSPENDLWVQHISNTAVNNLITELWLSQTCNDSISSCLNSSKNSPIEGSNFKCKECGVLFFHEVTLEHHMNVCHQTSTSKDTSEEVISEIKNKEKDNSPVVKKYMAECAICFCLFLTKEDCILHLDEKHDVKVDCSFFAMVDFPSPGILSLDENCCEVCGLKFRSSEYLWKHKFSHIGVKSEYCNICKQYFNSPLDLKYHTLNYHQCFLCLCCYKTFHTVNDLKTHSQLHVLEANVPRDEHGKMVIEIDDDGFEEESRLREKLLDEPEAYFYISYKIPEKYLQDSRLFHCQVCCKNIEGELTFIVHMRTHTSPHCVQCLICSSKFEDGAELEDHLESHFDENGGILDLSINTDLLNKSEEGIDKCQMCCEVFSSQQELKAHLNSPHYEGVPSENDKQLFDIVSYYVKKYVISKSESDCNHLEDIFFNWSFEWQVAEKRNLESIYHFKTQNNKRLLHPRVSSRSSFNYYICPYCYVFLKNDNVIPHLNKHEGLPNKVQCAYCYLNLNHEAIHSHMKTKHSDFYKKFNLLSNINCQLCSALLSLNDIPSHMISHKKDLPIISSFLKCAYCDLLMTEKELKQHMMIESSKCHHEIVKKIINSQLNNDTFKDQSKKRESVEEANTSFNVSSTSSGNQSINVDLDSRESEEDQSSLGNEDLKLELKDVQVLLDKSQVDEWEEGNKKEINNEAYESEEVNEEESEDDEIVKENGETDINSSSCVQNDEESRKPLVICIKRKKKNGSRGKVAKSKTTTTNSRSEDEFTTAGVQEEVIKDTKTIVKNKSKKEKGNLSNIDENGNFTSLKTKQNKDVKKDSRSKKNSNFEQKDNELQKQSTPKTCTIEKSSNQNEEIELKRSKRNRKRKTMDDFEETPTRKLKKVKEPQQKEKLEPSKELISTPKETILVKEKVIPKKDEKKIESSISININTVPNCADEVMTYCLGLTKPDCTICEWKFPSFDDLKSHLQKHVYDAKSNSVLNGRNICCVICFKLIRKTSIKTHLTVVHQREVSQQAKIEKEMQLKDEIPNKVVASKTQIIAYSEATLGVQPSSSYPFNCAVCGKGYFTSTPYLNHFKKTHPWLYDEEKEKISLKTVNKKNERVIEEVDNISEVVDKENRPVSIQKLEKVLDTNENKAAKLPVKGKNTPGKRKEKSKVKIGEERSAEESNRITNNKKDNFSVKLKRESKTFPFKTSTPRKNIVNKQNRRLPNQNEVSQEEEKIESGNKPFPVMQDLPLKKNPQGKRGNRKIKKIHENMVKKGKPDQVNTTDISDNSDDSCSEVEEETEEEIIESSSNEEEKDDDNEMESISQKDSTSKKIEILQCKDCPASFSCKSEFDTHLLSHKNNPEELLNVSYSFVCLFCGNGFYKTNGLKRHLQTKHKDFYTKDLEKTPSFRNRAADFKKNAEASALSTQQQDKVEIGESKQTSLSKRERSTSESSAKEGTSQRRVSGRKRVMNEDVLQFLHGGKTRKGTEKVSALDEGRDSGSKPSIIKDQDLTNKEGAKEIKATDESEEEEDDEEKSDNEQEEANVSDVENEAESGNESDRMNASVSSEEGKKCSKHICKYCDCIFRNAIELSKHKKQHNRGIKKNSNDIFCLCCKEKIYRHDLKWHMHTAHQNDGSINLRVSKRRYCIQCKFTTRHKKEFEEHTRTNHPELLKVECRLCDDRFATKNLYLEHFKLAHGKSMDEETLTCYLCNKRFQSLSKLHHHYSIVHMKKNESISCSLCSKFFYSQSDLDKHRERFHKDDKFQCGLCLVEFEGVPQCEEHVVIHKQKTNFRCKLCHFYFESEEILLNHISTHDTQIINCNICNTDFKTLNEYQTHKASHADGSCSKLSQKDTNESLHPKKPCVNKMYNCALCNKTFKTRSEIKSHMDKVHQGGTHAISSENERTDEEGLQSEEDSQMINHCDECGQTFIRPEIFAEHLKKHLADNKLQKSKKTSSSKNKKSK